MWARNLLFFGICAIGVAALAAGLSPAQKPMRLVVRPADGLGPAIQQLNASLQAEWSARGLAPAARADEAALARRLSLALLGTIPSLEELRALEQQPAATRLDWWLGGILADARHHDYLAERLARAYVGVEDGPFIIYRRRRFVAWLSDQLRGNRPYDQVVRDLITDSGLWTDRPATNFVTVTVNPDGGQGPDESKLAARVSRAFLGVRMDCAQCHDHPFESWKQGDFHGLAAYFGQTQQTFTGIRDRDGIYQFENPESGELETVQPGVPFQPELLRAGGTLRERLAGWVTHPDNLAFSRAIANRIWALVMGRPLVEPIDDIRPDDEVPPVLDLLARDFAAHGYDLRRLIQLIVASQAFQLDSRADPADPAAEITPAHEEAWAAFPITRLRPEQVVGAVLQSASLETIDHNSHIFVRIGRSIAESEFVQRYGDEGEEEFRPQGGTIPERLLMMNGGLVGNKTEDNIFANAVTRIAALASSDGKAVETTYLVVLSRRPTPEEARYFTSQLAVDKPQRRQRLEDLYWALLNSTEFSWNH
ncbi:MAG: DUF1549 domain-containing protein [Pirellulales bacterium]